MRTCRMSVADACLVRLTECMPEPLLLTTDADFKIYRRLGRRVIPTRMPGETGNRDLTKDMACRQARHGQPARVPVF